MSRPPLPVGTHGKITVYEVGPLNYRARCRYRDFDGRVYEVERYGTSPPKSVRRLKEALRDWTAPAGGDAITGESKFHQIAAIWMAELESDADSDIRSWGTVGTYRNRLSTIILPAVGELRMREVSTPIFNTLCRDVLTRSSASSAKTVRAILSAVCAVAVRHGALAANPVREVGALESKRARKRPAKSRALTADQVKDLLAKLDADEVAIQQDLPDLVRFFLGTGERTGEALAAHWPDLDEVAKAISMQGNVIRATGKGRVLNRGKSENAIRPIPLPDWCVHMLVERRAAAANLKGPIFPSTAGTMREASNIRNRAWNPFLQRAGYAWVTFRTLRKTVATLLDEAGLTARQIADVLGHSRPSMTQDVYMGRRSVSRAGADALDAALADTEQ
jgi:integrase